MVAGDPRRVEGLVEAVDEPVGEQPGERGLAGLLAGGGVLEAEAPLRLGGIEGGVRHVPEIESCLVDAQAGRLVLEVEQLEVCGNVGVGGGQGDAGQGSGIACHADLAPGGVEPGRDRIALDLRAAVEAQQPVGAQAVEPLLDELAVEVAHAVGRDVDVLQGVARQVHGQADGVALRRAMLLEAELLLGKSRLLLMAPFLEA